MRFKLWLSFLLISVLFLGGCELSILNNQASSTVKDKEDQVDAAEEEQEPTYLPPTTSRELDDILKDPGEGRFAGERYDHKKVYKALDEIPEGLKDEEIYGYLLELVGENYRYYAEAFDALEKADYRQDLGDISALKEENGQIKEQEKKINVQILLDASGSMAGKVDGKTKMDLAKKAIQDFAGSLPSHAEVSLRVYGHKGSNSNKDKKVSCASNEVVYPFSTYDKESFQKSLDKFQPTGWTPLAAAIQAAKEDLQSAAGESRENIIYIVSDGVETCGGDPVKEAKSLHQSDIEAVVNIIGFDVDHKGQEELKKVARAGGGTYQTVEDAKSLQKAFQGHVEGLNEANNNAYRRAVNRIDIAYKEDDRQNDQIRKEMLNATKRERSRMNEMLDYVTRKRKADRDQWATIGNWIDHDRWAALSNYANIRWFEVGSTIDNELRSSYIDVQNQWRENGYQIDKADQVTRVRVGGHRIGRVRVPTISTPTFRLPWGAPKPED